MTLISSGTSRALLRACALFLCIACASLCTPSTARSGMVPPVLSAANAPLLPDLQYFIDVTGTMDVEEAAAPANSQTFKQLNVKALPRVAGVMWLRFTLAPLPANGRSQAMLLDMGPDIPTGPILYEPTVNPATDGVEWREVLPSHRNVLLLPEPETEPVTCYIRLDGLPGIWFSPMLRTPQDAASNWGSLAGTAALLALGVVMLLCLLRGLSERGQWRVWTALYVGVALLQGVLGMPAYGSGHITLNQALAVLAPGLALMLLPHVGRHLMRTRGRSPLLDAQFILLSLPGAALALLPLFPGFGWSIRFLSLWPACTAIFTLSALGGAVMGLGGARRFLLGCLVPPLFVAAGVMGLDCGYAANLLASAPLWGTALSALLIAGTGLPRDAAQKDDQPRGGNAQTGNSREAKRESDAPTRRGTAALDAALISSSFDAGANSDPIYLDAPLDDPNLRLLPPSAVTGKTAADFSALPVDISDNSDLEPVAARTGTPKKPSSGVAPDMWENLLRPPLDRLMREGAALNTCSLPPAVRQYAENMLGAADELAKIIDNPGKKLEQTSVGEQRAAFNLQHLVREAHDAVSTAAENAGIGLAWYMPPLLGHMYEGQAHALRETLCLLLESAVRATTRGAVHLSVRRVPETADPGHLLFTVSDTGAGIPPRDRSSIALTRAWELAGSNSGYLNVECGPQGTSIAFTLRLKPLETSASKEPAPELRAPSIAVVAESAVDRQALAHMITTLGCNSTQARSMREALECNREAPALMLVAQYPQDGPTEADALGRFEAEALEAGLPVFKALAVTSDDTRWDALADAGYTHALLEPVDMEAFAATLREVLDEAGFADHGPVAPEMEAASLAPEVAETATATPVEEMPLPPESALESAPESVLDAEPLPDIFGQDAPMQDLLPEKPVSLVAPPLEMPLPHEAPLHLAADGQDGMPLPIMDGAAPAAEDDAPIELTELLPPEPAQQENGLILPVMVDEATAAPAEIAPAEDAPAADAPTPTAPMESETAASEPVDSAPAEAMPDADQATTARPLQKMTPEVPQPESLPEQPASPAQLEEQLEAQMESQPEISADVSSENSPETAAYSPQHAPLQAAGDNAAEFMASAGLEGPLWAAEEIAPQAAEAEPEAKAAPDLKSASAPAADTAPPAAEQPDAVSDAPGIPAPEENAHEPAPAPAEEAQNPLESINWPEPAQPDHTSAEQENMTPAEFLEAALPSEPALAAEPAMQPTKNPAENPAEQPVEKSAEALKAMTGRAGEATLSPVNSSGFDVPAPAGKGAWDTYSLQDEWVGEPMPIGTPIKTAGPAPKAAPQLSVADAISAPAFAPSAAPVKENKGYVSPSLAHPGEWVGEPMPISRPAVQEAPPAAPREDRAEADAGRTQRDQPRERQAEMPRTATGRLILKLLGSSGDRPAEADEDPLPASNLDIMADKTDSPSQRDAQAQLRPDAGMPDAKPPAAVAEPHRSSTRLRGGAAGNSIMNFIAGAAEALRSNGHDHAPHAQQGGRPDKMPAEQVPAGKSRPAHGVEQTDMRPQPAEFRQRDESPESVGRHEPAPHAAPRETDQTIPQLVARLDAAMDDAQEGFKNRRCTVVGDAANRIATESDAFGFRVLARMARCVERAAKANDMNALRDLLPELAVAVERNRIGLTPRR